MRRWGGGGAGTEVRGRRGEQWRGKKAHKGHCEKVGEEDGVGVEGRINWGMGQRWEEMQAGSYVGFQAGQKAGHELMNRTDQPCRYLVFGNPQPHDIAVFPDTGRVGVKLMGEGYRQAQSMAYWDGVDADTPA